MVLIGTPMTSSGGRSGASQMSAEEESSWLRSLARNTGTAIEQVGLALDTPGAIARGILAGDPLSGFNWDYDKRTSGEELLQSYGLLKEDTNPYLKAGAGFVADIATDPFFWVSTPLQSLSKAGKAASAAGLLDLAPMVAQKQMGSAALDTMTGRAADAAMERLLPRGLAKTEANYAVRPLVGPRLARTQTTLDDVVQAAKDPQSAMQDVLAYLDKKGLDYDAIKDQNLGGAFGLGPMSPLATFTPPGSEKVLDAMDALGQAIGWSYPARLASAAFDNRVAGQIDAGDQMAAIRQYNALDEAKSAGRRAAAYHADTVASIPMSDRAKTLLGADSLLSSQGNDFLTRMFEGKPTATDRGLAQELPGIDRAMASWDRIRRSNIAQADALGMDIAELQDPRFGVKYSPRAGTELDFGEYGTGFGRSQFQAGVSEDMNRNPALFTPGGTVDLREASKLPIVREWAKAGSQSPQSVAQVGGEIARYINQKHGYAAIDQNQGEAIARVMYRLNKDLPSDVPIFAGHPLNEQARAIISQETARANAKYVYDALTESAVPMRANQIPGSGFKNIVSAANEIAGRVGLKTGSGGLDADVQRNIVERLAQKMGVSPNQIDISQVAIPEQVYARLSRIQDFYSSPRAQQEVSGMLDGVTQAWKSFLLAFPARHVRDWYSNIASVWLETGSPAATTMGYSIARGVLAGDLESVLPKIAELPRYKALGNIDAVRQQFKGDVAAAGIMTGLAQTDALTAKRSGELSRVLPGVQPVTRLGSFKEFIPDGSRNPLQMAYDQTRVRGLTDQFETKNALLNWSQKLTDANDSIARLGGWLALMSQGVSPMQAADRMHQALVNYESLTTLERGLLRKIFPWYSYNSRIGKYVAQSLMENPGGSYAQLVRGVNTLQQSNDDTYVPQRLRQQISFRIPDEFLAAVGMPQTPGNTTFLTKFALPGLETFSYVDPHSIQGTIQKLASQTNPYIRGLSELAFDKDLFTGRSLADSDPAVNKIYRAATGGELSNTAKVVGQNFPGIQRIAGIGANLLDDRYPLERTLPKTAINAIAGFGIDDAAASWIWDDVSKQAERRLGSLKNDMVIPFLDEAKVAAAAPETQRAAEFWELVQKRKRQAKEEEKKRRLAPANPLSALYQ